MKMNKNRKDSSSQPINHRRLLPKGLRIVTIRVPQPTNQSTFVILPHAIHSESAPPPVNAAGSIPTPAAAKQ